MKKIYKIDEVERLKIEEEVISNIKRRLHYLLSCKIKFGSKAYTELELFIEEIENRRKKINSVIELILDSNKVSRFELHIESILVEKLLSISQEFNLNNIDLTIEYLLNYHQEFKSLVKLIKIENTKISERIDRNLESSDFYIATSKDISPKIVYRLDDLIIMNGILYFDIMKFKVYRQELFECFLFPSTFTLQELDKFFNLLIKCK